LISSDTAGFTAGGDESWLLISVSLGATEAGGLGLSASSFVLPAAPDNDVVEDAACPSGLVETSFVLLMAGVSWVLEVGGFGGATTTAGTLT
jgi:hypothetical protein